MTIINISWICPNCKAVIDMDEPLPITRDFDYDEFKETKKEYQEQYKFFSDDKPLLIDKLVEFAILVNKHNKKFWCNNWEISELYDKCNIRVVHNTRWYKFGRSRKLVKEFSLENKKPYKFKNILYGIECPMCHEIDTTKSETIDLSKE